LVRARRAIRRDALETYQRNAIGKLIEAKDPADVTKIIGGVFSGKNPVGAMRELITETSRDPAAGRGCARLSLIISSANSFRTPEYNLLKAIAADLRRSNRSLTAVKIPGQSNTAQDALPKLKKAMTPGSGSLLAQWLPAADTASMV